MVVLSTSPNSNVTGDLECTGIRLNNQRQKFRQRFDVIRKLGQGTYGKVQLALKKETGEEVAIKTIKKAKIQTKEDLIRIQREIQLMSLVQHPHIIHIYEVFENKEKIVLVMEYAAGGELYEYLSSEKNLSESEARRIFRQVVSAVYYCHKNNICHRDLKLENILLDENKNAKIADFGLSNVFDQKKLLETFCGSPLYASPEIVKGIPYLGPEVDCWSLGVLLYTLVYGAMPFDGSNFQKLVKQISEGEYYEPKSKSGASKLINRLLTVNATERANIENVCEDSWVNADCNDTLIALAENVENETPVRLDYLLQLSAEAPKADKESETKAQNDNNDLMAEEIEPNQCNFSISDIINKKHQLSASEGSISDVKKQKKNNVEISEVSENINNQDCRNKETYDDDQSIQQKSTTVATMNDPNDDMCAAELALKSNQSDQSETSSEDNTPEIDINNSKSLKNTKLSESSSQNLNSDYDSLSLNVLTTSSEQSVKSLDTVTGAEADDITWSSAASITSENAFKQKDAADKALDAVTEEVVVNDNVVNPENTLTPTNNNDNCSQEKEKPKKEISNNKVKENKNDTQDEANLEKNVNRFSSYEKEWSSNGPGEQYFREVKKDTEEVTHQGYSMHRSHVCTFEKSVIKDVGASEARKKFSITRSDSRGSTGSNDDLDDIFDSIAGENSWLCDTLARTKAIIEEFSEGHSSRQKSIFKQSPRLAELRAENLFSKLNAGSSCDNASFCTATSGVGSSRYSNTSSQKTAEESDKSRANSCGSCHSARINHEEDREYEDFQPYTSKMGWNHDKKFKTRSSSMPTEEMSDCRSFTRSVSEEDKQHSKTLINEESKSSSVSSSHFSSLRKNSSLSSQSSMSSKYKCEDLKAVERPKWSKGFSSQRSSSVEDYENKSEKHTSVKMESKRVNEESSSSSVRREFLKKDETSKPKSVFSYTKSRTHELLHDRQDEDDFESTVRRPRSLSLLCGDDNEWDLLLNKNSDRKETTDGAAAKSDLNDDGINFGRRRTTRFQYDKDVKDFETSRLLNKRLDGLERDFRTRFRMDQDKNDVGNIEKEIKEMTEDLSSFGGLRSRLREGRETRQGDTDFDRNLLFKYTSKHNEAGERSVNEHQDFGLDLDADNDLEESVSDRIKRKSYLVRHQDLGGRKTHHGTDNLNTNFDRLMSRNKHGVTDYVDSMPSSRDRLAHHSFTSRSSNQMFERRSNLNSRHERISSRTTSGLDEEQSRIKGLTSKKTFSFRDN